MQFKKTTFKPIIKHILNLFNIYLYMIYHHFLDQICHNNHK
jgi:hypothetical protein